MERQKDSQGQGFSHFYTAGTWHIRWCSTVYAIYWEFGMTCMMSHPRQRPLAESLWWLLYWPVTAILRQLGGCNQGPVGLDYRYTGSSGAQRSGYSLFTVTHVCLAQLNRHQTCKPVMVSVQLEATLFFQDTSMLILYKNGRMSDLCYLRKPRLHQHIFFI